jgi:hypothetical protein
MVIGDIATASCPPPDGVKMTKALPFTEASLARAIRGVERAGKFVVGVKPDGTLIVADKPLDVTSLLPLDLHNGPRPKWEDKPTRRFGEKLDNETPVRRRAMDYFDGGKNDSTSKWEDK